MATKDKRNNKKLSVLSLKRKFLGWTPADTVKLKQRTFLQEKDGVGTVQSNKMLPVTPISKVLPETNNVNYPF